MKNKKKTDSSGMPTLRSRREGKKEFSQIFDEDFTSLSFKLLAFKLKAEKSGSGSH